MVVNVPWPVDQQQLTALVAAVGELKRLLVTGGRRSKGENKQRPKLFVGTFFCRKSVLLQKENFGKIFC